MKDILALVEDKKVSLKYRGFREGMFGEIAITLFYFYSRKEYCVFQKDATDTGYKDPKEAIKKFNELIEEWENPKKNIT